MKNVRKILAVIFATVMIFSSTTTCFALSDEVESIEPRADYLYVDNRTATIDFISGKIVGKVELSGKFPNVTYNGTVSIQRKYGLIWINIEEWTGLTATGNFNFNDNSITPASGATYRVKYNVKATYSGDTETVTGTSASKAYGS